jgi:hypothetical protein
MGGEHTRQSRRRRYRWILSGSILIGLTAIGLWLFLPRKIAWIELGEYPSLSGASAVILEGYEARATAPGKVKFLGLELASWEVDEIARYHIWYTDTHAANYFLWRARTRPLVHTGGPQATTDVLHFRKDGRFYLGRYLPLRGHRITHVVECGSEEVSLADLKKYATGLCLQVLSEEAREPGVDLWPATRPRHDLPPELRGR